MTTIPTAEEITRDWGERCKDFAPDCTCCQMWAMHDEIERLRSDLRLFYGGSDGIKFTLGDRAKKKSGSSWQGHVVGFYSTKLTPFGYCVESEREPGSVQIYPEAALEFAPDIHDWHQEDRP